MHTSSHDIYSKHTQTISSSSSYSSFPSFLFFSFRSSLFGGVTPLASTRRRSSEEEEEDVDIESRSRKEAVRVTSSEQLQYLVSLIHVCESVCVSRSPCLCHCVSVCL